MIFRKTNAMRTALLLLLLAFTSLFSNSQIAPFKSLEKGEKDVTVYGEKGTLTITPYSNNIVRILPRTNENKLAPKASASVVMTPNAEFAVSETGTSVFVTVGDDLTVIVDKASMSVTFAGNGKTLARNSMPGFKSGNKRVYFFNTKGDDAFYGAGERGASTNLAGLDLKNFNKQNYGYGKGDRTTQMNITMPYFLSNKGYGIFFDDYSSSRLVLGNPVRYYTEIQNPVPYFFILGDTDNLGGVVREFTALTGRQDIAPLWALGYITSKYGYKTQSETEEVVNTLKSGGYPLDGVVLDLYWYGVETDMGRLEWNKEQWPDHKKMLADFKAKGVKTITISQPYLNKIGAIDNYNKAKTAGYLTKDKNGNVHDVTTWVGEAGMLDVSNPATCEWYWKQYKKNIEDGVSGLWGDLGEPEVHPLTIVHHNGETAAEYHNRYGNDWSRIIYDGFKREYPGKRMMTLMRGGTAGLQHYSVFPWSTDVSRSWGGLQAQIPIMINSSLSGLGYMSHDVGGFAVDSKNPTDTELYVRWLQLGLFTPVLRTHSTVKAEPYHYKEVEPVLKQIIRSRYEWLPYNYTLAYENAATGAPFVRPMNYYDPQNETLSDVEDQYFWGRDVLVAPVVEKGQTRRNVILPEGVWYDANNVKYNGGQTIDYAAPLEVLPTFVRGGAFIPKYIRDIESTDEYVLSDFAVTYYPAEGKSGYVLYDDDHQDVDAVADGKFQLIYFSAECSTDKINVVAETRGNGYAGAPDCRYIQLLIPMEKAPQTVRIDGTSVPSTFKNGQLEIILTLTGKITVDIER